MPELPEVETVRRGLRKLVQGSRITEVEIMYPKMIEGDSREFATTLRGKVLEGVDRRGKFLLLRFSDGWTVVSHLRMEGKYFVEKKGAPIRKHTHVIFNLDDGRQLRYNDVRKFGRMRLIKTGSETQLPSLKKLGPEPVAADFKVAAFYQGLQKKKKAIKPALLDQNLVTGLGNIYVDEVLWMSKIHPQTPCNHLTQADVQILHDNIIQELARAVEAGGTTIRSYTDAFQNEGGFQFELQAYQKTGQPCPRCQTPIERIVVGQRGTHFCPNCQQVK
ncbi:DNA-formamidopyrimidine glycosylase [Ligilactobacillus equi]|uniref:DNA-formamidopyrimidine glycosylase n=1 Tax=Ligilactobacillus equi TaxID=137357 RepID=UPI002ED6A5E8